MTVGIYIQKATPRRHNDLVGTQERKRTRERKQTHTAEEVETEEEEGGQSELARNAEQH